MEQTREKWQSIETAPKQKGPFGPWLILGHDTQKWVRIGHFRNAEGLWYYSGTNERCQYNEIKGDKPTHWQWLPNPPEKPDETNG